jgi:hypothetical protein
LNVVLPLKNGAQLMNQRGKIVATTLVHGLRLISAKVKLPDHDHDRWLAPA